MLSVSLKRSGRHGHEVLMGARRLSKLEFWVCIARRLGAFFFLFTLAILSQRHRMEHGIISSWDSVPLGSLGPHTS